MKLQNRICLVFILLGVTNLIHANCYHSKLGNDKKSEIKLSFNYSLTTSLLNPPYVSGVINDDNDPAAIKGIFINIERTNKSNKDLKIIAESDNILVLKNENILVQKNEQTINVKIIPSKVGYANIKITAIVDKSTYSIDIYYACSNATSLFYKTIWHTGISDASAAIALDHNYMIVADDEKNQLCIFNRSLSGLPFYKFDYSNLLNLSDGNGESIKEVDCEAATRSIKNPNRIYWMGSMSNGGKSNKLEENRNRIFATDITDSAENTKFLFKGFISNLRSKILKWGDINGLNLSRSADYGMSPKQKDGFNIEGMVFGPDSTTLYIAFRAPLAPVDDRKSAIIIPILNFENWFNNGKPTSEPIFDKPIFLNLGTKGIRDIILLKNNKYLIVAGSSDEKKEFSLFLWSGLRKDSLVEIKTNQINEINPEAVLELKDELGNNYIELISDCGRDIYYDDNISAKYLVPEYKKFRSDIIKINNLNF